MFGIYFVMQYLVSFPVLQSTKLLVFLIPCAVGWSGVCDYGISWLYTLSNTLHTKNNFWNFFSFADFFKNNFKNVFYNTIRVSFCQV